VAPIAANGVKTIVIETGNRFARDLIVQETGWRFLHRASPSRSWRTAGQFPRHDPDSSAHPEVLGAVSQLEKAALVAKLKAAHERKKALTGKCGGRKSVDELSPETVALAKKLHRYPINRRKRSLRGRG
jgi:hypothetical protein